MITANLIAGVFYWMLLNIHPAHRSSLHSIQLLAVVKSSCLKTYGIDVVLKPAIDDLLKLADDVSCAKAFIDTPILYNQNCRELQLLIKAHLTSFMHTWWHFLVIHRQLD